MTAETSRTMEEVIKNANSFGKYRLSGKLYLWVGKSGKKTFKLRSNIDGKDKFIPIGQYPAMNHDQAWEKAKEWQTKIDNVRRINEEAEWNDKVNQSIVQGGLAPTNEKCRSFKDAEEAGQFIRKLAEIEDDKGIKTEIRLAIWLQLLLLPSRPSELLLAKRKDFDLGSRLWTTIKDGKTKVANIPYAKHRITILSQSATTAIQELDSLPVPAENDGLPIERYLFPHLAKMKRHIREETISKEMQRIWPSFTIEPGGFQSFFKNMACNNRYYREKFADEMLKRVDGQGDLIKDPEYIHHRKLLADWWGDGLMWLRNPASARQPADLLSSDLKCKRMTKPMLPELFLKKEPERTLPRFHDKASWGKHSS